MVTLKSLFANHFSLFHFYNMALIASLQFGDNDSRLYSNTYTVCDVKCHIRRPYNRFHPDGIPRCESVQVTVVAPGMEDLTLLDWYVRQSPMAGRLVIAMSNEAKMEVSADKEILFENAVCFRLAEDYHIDDNRRRLLTLTFTADVLTVDKVSFKRN